MNTKPIRTMDDARDYLELYYPHLLARFGDGTTYTEVEQCRRCGGAGYYPTKRHGACFDCGGDVVGARRTQVYELKRTAQRAKAKDAKHAREEAAREEGRRQASISRVEFLASHPGLEEVLECSIPLIAEFKEQLQYKGTLSDRQVEVAMEIVAKRKADESTQVPAPTGRQEFTGEVVSCKESFSDYGTVWRLTIKVTTDDGGTWLANGTAPKQLLRDCEWRYPIEDEELGTLGATRYPVIKGRVLTLTATLEQSDSPHFAFYKRPTKATLAAE